MTDDELRDALDGLFAADAQQTNGIRDEGLRSRCIEEMWGDEPTRVGYFTPRLSRIARELYLSDRAIDFGYRLEDMRDFINWLDERMRPS